MNERITVPEVRLISHTGEQVGVVSTPRALAMAQEVGLDLVEVSPNNEPPVCKLMDAGKQKYLRKKRESEQRKRQSRNTVKEVKLRPKTDDHDILTKARRTQRFLEGGDKVKVTIMFRGREMAHPQIARAHLDRMIEVMGEIAVVEQTAVMEGRNMFVILAPSRDVLKAVAAERAAKTKERAAKARERLRQRALQEGEAEREGAEDTDLDDGDEALDEDGDTTDAVEAADLDDGDEALDEDGDTTGTVEAAAEAVEPEERGEGS